MLGEVMEVNLSFMEPEQVERETGISCVGTKEEGSYVEIEGMD